MQDFRTALAWYSPEEYEKFLAAADDPEVWEEDYLSWKRNAEQLIGEMSLKGMEIVKIPLVLDRFSEWCAENDLKNDASARSRYAASELQKRN